MTSNDDSSDAEIFTFANSFISGVLGDAVTSYRRQQREEQDRLEAMWRRAQERFELDAMYFNAEFSRVWKNEEKSNTKSRKAKSEAPLPAMGGSALQRWGSFDACACSDNAQPLLLPEIKTSTIEDRSSPVLLVAGGRRASEPTTARRRDSHDVHLLDVNNSHLFVRRRSSQASASSRELILEWLHRNATAHHNTHARTDLPPRVRTSSSYLEWFVQDLLVESFNGAFAELFGGDVTSYLDLSGAVALSPINQSFSSNQTDVCELAVTIPDEASCLVTSPLDCDAPTPNSARTSSSKIPRNLLQVAGNRRGSGSSFLSLRTISSVEDDHATLSRVPSAPSFQINPLKTNPSDNADVKRFMVCLFVLHFGCHARF